MAKKNNFKPKRKTIHKQFDKEMYRILKIRAGFVNPEEIAKATELPLAIIKAVDTYGILPTEETAIRIAIAFKCSKNDLIKITEI